MTNKATDMQSASREKPRLTTTRSAPALISTSSTMQVHRRQRTKQMQQPKISSINLRCKSFPNEACRAGVDNNNVIDSIAEPYLVPITTNKTLSQVTKAKKVALLPRTAQSGVCSQKAVWESSRRLVPPPRQVSRNTSSVKLPNEQSKRVSFVSQDKLCQSKRRELAYLVVDLSTARERKKSFDDLDAELELRLAREDRSSLTRSNTISGRIKAPKSPQDRAQMTTPRPKVLLTSPGPIPPKRGVRKWPPSSSSSGSGTTPSERISTSSNTDSGGTAESANLSDLSSDAFLSSTEVSSDKKCSPRLNKQTNKQPKRRAPPPPPNTLPRSIPPPPYGPAPILLTPPQPLKHMRDKSPSLSVQTRRLSNTDTKPKVCTLGKSNSITQLSSGRPFVRPRPPNTKTKPKVKEAKVKESRSTSQVGLQPKMRPTISSPHLISSTKAISSKSKPVSGPFRRLPSPPLVSESIPTQTHLLHTTQDGFNSPYEDVEFSPPSPSLPIPPPRPKRDQKRQSNSSGTKATQKPFFVLPSQNIACSKPPSQSLSSLQRKLDSSPSPKPCGVPMDYSEPVLSGEMKESDDDEPVGDYVDMSPGVLTEWTQSRVTEEEQDHSEDCYVEMQPGLDPFASDKPEPIYIEMNSQDFVRPPPEKPESLYYATKDLFFNRKDLQVQASSKRT